MSDRDSPIRASEIDPGRRRLLVALGVSALPISAWAAPQVEGFRIPTWKQASPPPDQDEGQAIFVDPKTRQRILTGE